MSRSEWIQALTTMYNKKILLYEEKQGKINLNLELKLNKKSSYSTLNIKFRTLNIKPNFKGIHTT